MYLHRDHTSCMLRDVNYWFAVLLDNQQSLLSMRIDSDSLLGRAGCAAAPSLQPGPWRSLLYALHYWWSHIDFHVNRGKRKKVICSLLSQSNQELMLHSCQLLVCTIQMCTFSLSNYAHYKWINLLSFETVMWYCNLHILAILLCRFLTCLKRLIDLSSPVYHGWTCFLGLNS